MIRKILFPSVFLAIMVFLVFILVFIHRSMGEERNDPWAKVNPKPEQTVHSHLFEGKTFPNGPSVTRACLDCHPDAARDLMKTSHWNWLGEPVKIEGHPEPVRVGKRNVINNFCISIEGNWPRCTVCHAGYGWSDAQYDFAEESNVDCLVCHDRSGTYAKTLSGYPDETVDLLAVAKRVGRPTRDNCGWCHFNGGGGDAVKHGDLDGSLAKPVERIDVHMGRNDFQCIDCHRTQNHDISGRMMSVSVNRTLAVECSDCHGQQPHANERLNSHGSAVACQTCHLPHMAIREPTKVAWDWSTAGQDIPGADPHHYLKQKGSFVYAKKSIPEYYWFNGNSTRYLKGDTMNPDTVTHLNSPLGGISDPGSKIFPFKVHRGKQPYDEVYKTLIVPKVYGEGGYWSDYDWIQAATLGGQESGLPFSGRIGFAETDMYWLLSHMIAPAKLALSCSDCHHDNGRMNWQALGYGTDPAYNGGRLNRRLVLEGQ